MTTEYFKKEFLKNIDSYNSKQSQVPNYDYLIPVEKEKKIFEYRSETIKSFEPKFKDLLFNVQSLMKLKIREKNEKKFPLRYSNSVDNKILSEQKKINSHLLFSQLRESPDLLLNELKMLLESEDFDSIYSLLDIIYSFAGDNVNQDFQKLLAFKKEVDENLKIIEIENELEDLKSLESNIQKTLEILSNNIPYILLAFEVENMTDNEYFGLRNNLVEKFGDSITSQIFSLQ